jgi:hypothetical protein
LPQLALLFKPVPKTSPHFPPGLLKSPYVPDTLRTVGSSMRCVNRCNSREDVLDTTR